MVTTLHYSGNVMSHPDTAEQYAARQAYNKSRSICKYKKYIPSCPYVQERAKNARFDEKINLSQCQFSNCDGCPGRQMMQEVGNTKKRFRITNTHFRDLANRAGWLYHNSDNKLLFITLTFPEFKKKRYFNNIKHNGKKFHFISKKPGTNRLNNAFSKYVENLKKNYHRGGYIAVREGNSFNTGNNKDVIRYHFHVVVSLPYIPFNKLNSGWLAAISDFCESSANALTTDKKARFVTSPARAIRYIAKYMSKSRGTSSHTRIIFIDRTTAQAVVKKRIDDLPELIDNFGSIEKHQLNDYVAIWSVKNWQEQERFIKEVVQVYFKSHSQGTYLYHFPDSNPQ